LCGSKKEREDWSDPGYLLVGKLPDSPDGSMELQKILTGLTKNHGYYRGLYQGEAAGYVACEEGLFTVVPKSPTDWETTKILSGPFSDVALWDLNGDGVDELIAIEPFHGDTIQVYEQKDGNYTPVYKYPRPIAFAHAIQGAVIGGQSCCVIGIRRQDAELAILRNCEGKYQVEVLETGVGPSNVAVAHSEQGDILLAANHTKNEGAIYLFEKENLPSKEN